MPLCSRQPLALDPLAGWTRGSMQPALTRSTFHSFSINDLAADLPCNTCALAVPYYHRPNDAVTVAVLASMAVLLFGADALLSK